MGAVGAHVVCETCTTTLTKGSINACYASIADAQAAASGGDGEISGAEFCAARFAPLTDGAIRQLRGLAYIFYLRASPPGQAIPRPGFRRGRAPSLGVWRDHPESGVALGIHHRILLPGLVEA